MISSTPNLKTENVTFSHSIYLLLTNNNYFDLLLIRGIQKKLIKKLIKKINEK